MYIHGGKNSAYVNPHIPAVGLGSTLEPMLGELRPQEDWLRIFQAILDETTVSTSFETPRKRQFRYYSGGEGRDSPDADLLASFSAWDFETIGSEEVKRLAQSIHSMETHLKQFQIAVGEDVDQLISKVQDVKAVVCTATRCITRHCG